MSSNSVSVRSADGEWQEVRGIASFDYVSDVSDTDEWVQSVTDAICVRLHRGDDPVCDCGQNAAR